MSLDTNVKKSLTELNYIINNMSDSLQNKIPKELKETIEEQMDKEYILDIDITKKYTQQNFLPETKALLSLLLSDYIGNEEYRKKWKDFDNKYEEILQKNIKTGIFENNTSSVTEEKIVNNEEKQLIGYNKQSFVKRILNKIMNFFRKRG